MSKRTSQYQLFPWQGGLVTSVDQSLLQNGQLTVADHLIMDTRGSKRKREGVDEGWDNYGFTAGSRSSSTTTRVLTGLDSATAVAVGDVINVTGGPATYNGTGLAVTAVSALDFTAASGSGLVTEGTDTINVNSHGLTDDRWVWYTSDGTAIGGLVSGHAYWAVSTATNTFKLALTKGGSAIDLTNDGVGNHRFRSLRISYTADTSLSESVTAETGATIEDTSPAVGGHDFWFGSTSRAQYKLMINAAGKVFYYDTSGVRARITDGGTAWTVSPALDQVSMLTFNNKILIAVDGALNTMKYWTGVPADPLADVPNAPLATLLQEHVGRVWSNDKTNKDRLQYSATFDETVWGGTGDSGAIDIGLGDGDPEGIIAIFPTFKGDLFVAKRTKLYRITGSSPEEFQVILVSNGIGCISHRSVVAVDQDDVMFVSDKGVHSLAATDQFGSFSSAYVSVDIQRTINEDWTKSRFRNIQAAYINELNSVAFAVSENSSTNNRSIYFYNIPLKAWFRWPDMECNVMFTAQDSDRRRLYLGTSNSRLTKTQTGNKFDLDSDGEERAIEFSIATGLIFPDGAPIPVKAFFSLTLIYKPVGEHRILATAKIDNYSPQALVFSQTGGTDLLGSTFILGTSSLGYEVVMAPYTQQIDGRGRGIKITLSQSGINEEVEIQGLAVEFEVTGPAQETQGRSAS